MAALDRRQNLLSYARRGGSIPQDGLGVPWFNDGNIFLFTNDRAFKIYMGHLRENAPQFEERLNDLSDDSVDFIQNHPAIAVDDSSDDLAYFLSALFEGYGSEFPLESDDDFIALSAILRLSTKYRSQRMRENAIRALQRKFPLTLYDWALLASSMTFRWTCDPIVAINLARSVSTFSILPAAMASLSNDASAGEVFRVPLHEGIRLRNSSHELCALEDIRGFALMKEHNHGSIVRLINFVHEVGRECKQPPESEPRPSLGMSPVGTRRQEYRASICSKIFRGLADILVMQLNKENPMGYHDFSILVWDEGTSQKLPVCRRCRSSFKDGCEDLRSRWWSDIPNILGLPEAM